MALLIVLAMLNGIVVALGRTVNGRLGQYVGALQASFWNHLVGFVFLCLMMLALYGAQIMQMNFADVPPLAWSGGLLGAFFVLLSSYVFPKLGAMKASMLIIAGQVLSSVVFDIMVQGGEVRWIRVIGVVLITAGIVASTRAQSSS